MRYLFTCFLGMFLFAELAGSANAIEYKRRPVYQGQYERYVPPPPENQSGQATEPAPQSYQDYIMGYDKRNRPTRFAFTTGLRTDSLDWNIAADPSGTVTPNVLSELTWSDLQVLELGFDFSHTQSFQSVGGASYVEFNGAIGKIFKGDNQDSDWFGDNRTQEFSRSNNDGGDGSTIDLSVALGYAGKWALPWNQSHVMFIPIGGYALNIQNLRMTDGFQTIPASGSFAGLNSRYDATWKGPFFGAIFSSQIDRHRFNLRGEYHIAKYSAEADWNLRTDFAHPISFVHKTDGTGVSFRFDYAYLYTNSTEFIITAMMQQWEGEAGLDRTFFSDNTFSETRLNEVNWESQSLRAGVNYRF